MHCTVNAQVKQGDKYIPAGETVDLSKRDISRLREKGFVVTVQGGSEKAPEFGKGWPLAHDAKASESLAEAGWTTVEAVLNAGEEKVTALPNVGAGTWRKFEALG